MYDIDMRRVLKDSLYKNNSRIIDELDVGNRRADVVEITDGKMICYEIKSDHDTLRRLDGQIKQYCKFFDEIIIVVGKKYIDKVIGFVPTFCGIYLIESNELRIIRKPTSHNKVKIKHVMSLLWKIELNSIIDENNFPKKYKRVAKTLQRKYIISEIQESKLKNICISIICERRGWK